LPGVTGDQQLEPVTWGLGDAALGFAAAYLFTILLSPVAYAMTGVSTDTKAADLPLSTIALLQVPFYAGMLAVAIWASMRKGRGPVTDFGIGMRWIDAPQGLGVGVVTQFAATFLYLPLIWLNWVDTNDISKPARELTDKAHGSGVVLLILVVVVAAPIVEEIFFRGLILRSLQRRFSQGWAIVLSSALFAAAHVEALQFPALFVFGLVAAWLATRSGRLGPGIWAHVAFNAFAVISLLR
jgi:membrane protease YdiL (CAAX protease family)